MNYRKNFFLLGFLLVNTLLLADSTFKHTIKSNGQAVYGEMKNNVDNFKDMFKEGSFYGRLRNNNFYFAYNYTDAGHEDNLISAIGTSLIYKSASLKSFDFALGLYASHAFFDASRLDAISHLKSSKDTLSRYKYANGGSKSLYALGQANINYNYSKTNFILGRQLVETFYTKSNDTKMIPNTFDGLVISSKDISDTSLKLAYLTKQKLRDHEKSHAVLMVGDENSPSGVNHPEWSENDDSPMHRGLTYSALKAAGKPTDAPLIVLDVVNNSIQNLKINFSSYVVPELLSQAMGELNYKLDFDGFSLTPGFRYLQQFDNGAGAVGGASLFKIGLSGYKNPSSLNSQMIATKVALKRDDYKLTLAYTNILDKADLVSPWRGFPTSGYTRSMGMYNWRANTKSYRLELVKGANDTGVYRTPFVQTSVLYIDGDQKKEASDSMFYYAGLVQNIPTMLEFQYRVRLGYRDFVGPSSVISDYIDSRLEFNYLF
ncbi:MAG: OprD family outer membrane porin [Sulfurimonas sp.]